jgi:hypothetical protein
MSGFKNITIERYDAAKHDTPDGPWPYSGLIEGEDDTGNRWIMWLDRSGRPEIFWPERDHDTGAVIGEAIRLDRRPGQFSGVFEQLGVPDDSDADESRPEVITSFPVFFPEDTEITRDEHGRYTNSTEGVMRGIVFAVVPGDGSANERMRQFISAFSEGLGMVGPQQRIDRMRQILDSDTPERVVQRLREALQAANTPDDVVRECIQRLSDSKATQQVSSM